MGSVQAMHMLPIPTQPCSSSPKKFEEPARRLFSRGQEGKFSQKPRETLTTQTILTLTLR